MKTWHIITCEYPPQTGGVADYTRILAHHLASVGDAVHVWAPSEKGEPDKSNDAGVEIQRSLGAFLKQDLAATESCIREVKAKGPMSILVQWVPHGYGKRGINLEFCHWIEKLAKSGFDVELVIHEPFLVVTDNWKQKAVALMQRRMMRSLLDCACRVFISIPAWERYLRPLARTDLEMRWLPIPATVPVVADSAATAVVRKRVAGRLILGHLGTYGGLITPALESAVTQVLKEVADARVLFLGKGSEEFAARLTAKSPSFRNRIVATGMLKNDRLSHHLTACDLMLQPYPDGLSSRRTSLMNALAHGLAVVSSSGHLTEEIWESGAVALAATGAGPDLAQVCIRLLRDETERGRFARAGADLYRDKFDWPNVIEAIRTAPPMMAAGQTK